MVWTRRDFLALCAAGPFAALAPHASRAAGYPSRPIRIIVPYAAGGPNDIIARMIAGEAFRREGASFVIENIPGGAGNAGTAAAARAAGDGYTLVVVTSSFFINPSLNSKIQYTQVKDAKLGALGASYCKLGEGDVQVQKFLIRLKGIGYNGYVSLEWEKAWLPNLAEPEEILPQAIEKLRGWAKVLDVSDWEGDAAAKAPPKKPAAAAH